MFGVVTKKGRGGPLVVLGMATKRGCEFKTSNTQHGSCLGCVVTKKGRGGPLIVLGMATKRGCEFKTSNTQHGSCLGCVVTKKGRGRKRETQHGWIRIVAFDALHCGLWIMNRVGQSHIYTVCIRYFWQGNHQIYGHIRFWPTLVMSFTWIRLRVVTQKGGEGHGRSKCVAQETECVAQDLIIQWSECVAQDMIRVCSTKNSITSITFASWWLCLTCIGRVCVCLRAYRRLCILVSTKAKAMTSTSTRGWSEAYWIQIHRGSVATPAKSKLYIHLYTVYSLYWSTLQINKEGASTVWHVDIQPTQHSAVPSVASLPLCPSPNVGSLPVCPSPFVPSFLADGSRSKNA